MRLDPESKQYVAINIHRGLTRHESCSFGKASSHAIFQCTMKICIATAELNSSDFCILPNQANSLLNFGNFRKAKNVFPHCPIFFSIFYYIYYLTYFLFFSLFFPLFPNLLSTFARHTFKICPATDRYFNLYVFGNISTAI